MPLQTYSPDWEPRDQLFLTHLFPELTQVDLWAAATTSQCLTEGARHSKETLAATTLLPAYVTEFQSVFAKKDFDILPEYHKWDHAIELIPRAEPKSLKVYPLSVRATGVDSRRFLRELDEAPGGNNLQYILKCPCIPFFGN